MNCKKVNDLLNDYLSKCLPEDQCCLVELHIRECGDCANELETYQDIRRELRALSYHEAPVHVWSCIREKVAGNRRAESCWSRWIMRPLVIAPALAVLLLLTIFLIHPFGNSDRVTQARALLSAPEYGSYITAHSGVQRHIPFSDPDVAFVAAELDKASFVSVDKP